MKVNWGLFLHLVEVDEEEYDEDAAPGEEDEEEGDEEDEEEGEEEEEEDVSGEVNAAVL